MVCVSVPSGLVRLRQVCVRMRVGVCEVRVLVWMCVVGVRMGVGVGMRVCMRRRTRGVAARRLHDALHMLVQDALGIVLGNAATAAPVGRARGYHRNVSIVALLLLCKDKQPQRGINADRNRKRSACLYFLISSPQYTNSNDSNCIHST